MDATVDRLARKALTTYAADGTRSRILIGIAGVPGSGKTTLVSGVVSKINELVSDSSPDSEFASLANPTTDDPAGAAPLAVSLPMDGFHLYRAQLHAMPNPAEAVRRRGAAFTFDGLGFAALITRLKAAGPSETVYAPSFGHEIKDPVQDDIAIPGSARIVLVEGLYVALDEEPWRGAAEQMSMRWFVEVDREVAWKRLAKRHLESGICRDEREAIERASGSDEENAVHIRAKLLPCDETFLSQ